ncbi:MAG: hypothetical protein LUE87_10770, partial [Lachnospiraceae bacterium]|nr:hypothetical protein [Lachnospiraceae bacterium]
KQVEGMIKYGYPYGYFGFNESHAQILSFAAWSPVLFWPWLLWGLIFGWNLLSPVYCNIFLLSLAVFLFVWLTKASGKQCAKIAVLFALFPLFTRYMMSSMPEITCFSMVIVFFGFAYSYYRRENTGKLAAMFALSAVMTLMRPYLIVFMVLPMLILIWKKGWAGLVASLGIGGITGVLYICINHFLAAEYFTALFDTSWLTNFIRHGLVRGSQEFVDKFTYSLADFFRNCYQGLTSGLATGAFFIGFLVVMVLVLGYAVYCFVRRDWKEGILYGHLALCFFAMWMALMLMYKMQEGSKHLLTFIAVGIFALAMMEGKPRAGRGRADLCSAASGKPVIRRLAGIGGCLPVVICAAVFAYLYLWKAETAYDYQLCFRSEELAAEIDRAKLEMEAGMPLQTQNVPGYENDVIWVLSDSSEDGEWLVTDYQLLYSLPAGFGINCCDAEYVLSSFDELQSKYICTAAGGQIDRLCQERGLTVVTEGLNAVIYQLR